jgi:hypothetical protein
VTPTILVTLATTTVLTIYAVACWALPFGRCRFCGGKAHHATLILRRLRPCRLCKGTGRRLRYGRRAFNYLSRIHHDATHTRKAASR